MEKILSYRVLRVSTKLLNLLIFRWKFHVVFLRHCGKTSVTQPQIKTCKRRNFVVTVSIIYDTMRRF